MASVPQEVKIISLGFAEISLAVAFRAFVTIFSACMPKICKDDGLPQVAVKALFIYLIAFSQGFVVAELSR